jgi:hypothetical protein
MIAAAGPMCSSDPAAWATSFCASPPHASESRMSWQVQRASNSGRNLACWPACYPSPPYYAPQARSNKLRARVEVRQRTRTRCLSPISISCGQGPARVCVHRRLIKSHRQDVVRATQVRRPPTTSTLVCAEITELYGIGFSAIGAIHRRLADHAVVVSTLRSVALVVPQKAG